MSSTPTRVAMVGAGYFGAFHYDAWARMPEAEICAICVPEPDTAQEMAVRWGRDGAPLPIFSDAADMVRATGADIVDITAPPAAHLPTIEAVATMGADIVCQKPFCGDLPTARRAVNVAKGAGVRLAVHENIRFQPWYRAVRATLDEGGLGTPYQVTFRLRPGDGQGADAYLDRQPYFQRMPRFLMHETGIHWIDTFRYLFGEIDGVFARLSRLNPAIEGEDAGIAYFDFSDGMRGVFDGNRLSDHAAKNRRLAMGEMLIEGSNGSLRLDGDGRLWLRKFGSDCEEEQKFEWRDHLFGGDCVYLCNRHIFQSWQSGVEPETDAGKYLRNMEIVEASYESHAEGRYVKI